MVYTTEMMIDDDNSPHGTIKRTILVDNITNIATIKFLAKKGYSWVDTRMGMYIGGYQFVITDQDGNLMLKAEPPEHYRS